MLAGVPGGILRQGGPLGWEAVMLGLPPPLVLQITGGLNADGQEFLWAATEEDGILRSLDGGQSWQAWNFGLLDANMFGLAVSPHFRTDRQIWAATSTGLFRSWNGGVGWECCPIMNVEKYTRVEQIACGVSGGQVWLVAGSANMGLWRTHGGSEWWEQCKGYPLGLEPAKLRSVPGLEGWLLCLGGNQLWGSQDEGRNFIPLGPEYPVVMSYACLNGEVWLACEDGIHRLPL